MGSPKRAGSWAGSAPRQGVAPGVHVRTVALLVFASALLTGLVAWHGGGVLPRAAGGGARSADSGPLLGLVQRRWVARGVQGLTSGPATLLAAGLTPRGAGASALLLRQSAGQRRADAAGSLGSGDALTALGAEPTAEYTSLRLDPGRAADAQGGALRAAGQAATAVSDTAQARGASDASRAAAGSGVSGAAAGAARAAGNPAEERPDALALSSARGEGSGQQEQRAAGLSGAAHGRPDGLLLSGARQGTNEGTNVKQQASAGQLQASAQGRPDSLALTGARQEASGQQQPAAGHLQGAGAARGASAAAGAGEGSSAGAGERGNVGSGEGRNPGGHAALPAAWPARWALPQDPSVCISLESNASAPLGPAERELNPLCGPLARPGVRRVAIVGNGPLNETARAGVAAADLVVRFNLMNNWRRFEEAADVWVIRFSAEASLRYWGITNLRGEDAVRVVAGTQAVWLLGGAQEDADALVQRVPALQGPPRKALRLPLPPLAAAYTDWLRLPSGSPSTGFVGIAAVLHCAAPDAVIHLYGMNWHEKNWRGHKMGAERSHWAPAEAAGRLVVHPTPCHGMRECGQARPQPPWGDLDQSCHWEGGRYLCIAGKPRRWTDFTGLLEEGREADFLRPPPAADTAGADAAERRRDSQDPKPRGAAAARLEAAQGSARRVAVNPRERQRPVSVQGSSAGAAQAAGQAGADWSESFVSDPGRTAAERIPGPRLAKGAALRKRSARKSSERGAAADAAREREGAATSAAGA